MSNQEWALFTFPVELLAIFHIYEFYLFFNAETCHNFPRLYKVERVYFS